MKRKIFEEWFNESGYEKTHVSSVRPLIVPMLNAFHANDEYMDYQDKRIAELESLFKDNGGCIKTAMQLLNEHSVKVKELERQNALYLDQIKYKDLDIEMYRGSLANIKKCVDSKQDLISWQKNMKTQEDS